MPIVIYPRVVYTGCRVGVGSCCTRARGGDPPVLHWLARERKGKEWRTYTAVCRKRDYVSSLANPFSAPYGTKELGAVAAASVSSPHHAFPVTLANRIRPRRRGNRARGHAPARSASATVTCTSSTSSFRKCLVLDAGRLEFHGTRTISVPVVTAR